MSANTIIFVISHGAIVFEKVFLKWFLTKYYCPVNHNEYYNLMLKKIISGQDRWDIR